MSTPTQVDTVKKNDDNFNDPLEFCDAVKGLFVLLHINQRIFWQFPANVMSVRRAAS